MNKATRKEIDEILDRIREETEKIRAIASVEMDKYDNMPEGLQESDSGQKLLEISEDLEAMADEIESTIDEHGLYNE